MRRSTKISFRDQDKLNWFAARPAQRWVTPQIQLLICPLYSPKLPPTKKKKNKAKMHKGMQDFERVTSREKHTTSGEFCCKNKGFAFL